MSQRAYRSGQKAFLTGHLASVCCVISFPWVSVNRKIYFAGILRIQREILQTKQDCEKY